MSDCSFKLLSKLLLNVNTVLGKGGREEDVWKEAEVLRFTSTETNTMRFSEHTRMTEYNVCVVGCHLHMWVSEGGMEPSHVSKYPSSCAYVCMPGVGLMVRVVGL